NAAVRGFSLADLDPAAVAAPLDVRLTALAMSRDSFLYPGIAVSLRIQDQSAFGSSTQDCFESCAGHHHVRVGCKKLAIMAVAYNEPVLCIIKRKSIGYGSNRVSKTGTFFAVFLYVRFLHLDSRCAKYPQRFRHPPDLIGTAFRKGGAEIASRQGQHSLAQRGEPSHNVASNIEPSNQGRTDQAERDHRKQADQATVLDRLRLVGCLCNALFRCASQGLHRLAQLSRQS